MTTAIQKYEDWDDEAAKEDQEAFEATANTLNRFKPPVGSSVVRILPPLYGLKSPFRYAWEHYISAPGSEKKKFFVCPKMQTKQDRQPARFCPACAHLDSVKINAKTSKEIEYAEDQFRANRTVYANVLVRGREGEGIKVWGFSKTIFDMLIEMRRGAGGINYVDPIHGFDVRVKRVGTGMKDTKYTIFQGTTRPLLDEDDAAALDELLEAAPNLNALARILPNEAILELWAEAFGEAPELDDEPPPARRHAASKPVTGTKPATRPKTRTAADDAIDTEGEAVDDDFG